MKKEKKNCKTEETPPNPVWAKELREEKQYKKKQYILEEMR